MKMFTLPSNLSIEERLKFVSLPETVEQQILEGQDIISALQKKLYAQGKDFALVEEQLNFARELVTEIMNLLKVHTKAKELKHAIKMAQEESFLEL
jgi:hypothetical protein